MSAIYCIDGRPFHAPSRDLEDAIAAAHAIRHRPLCMCRPSGVEMYTARTGSGCIVKRLPFTGSQHAVTCRSYGPPEDHSGLGQVLESAVIEDPATGLTNLRVDFALSKRQRRATASPSNREFRTAVVSPNRLSLRGLLHHLWNAADLTLWRPGFAGKRTWTVVRGRLLTVADGTLIQGKKLRTRLFVPERFRVDERDAILARQIGLWSRLSPGRTRSRSLVLMLAELKEIAPSRHGYDVVVKHLPDRPFSMDEVLFRRMQSRFERELSIWSASNRVRMIIACSFQITQVGNPRIEELSLMTTDYCWIPIEDRSEHRLLQRLVGEDRTFRKCLRFDLGKDCLIASALLLDIGEAGLPLFIQRPDGHGFGRRTDSVDGAWWIWDLSSPDGSVPSLPPANGRGSIARGGCSSLVIVGPDGANRTHTGSSGR